MHSGDISAPMFINDLPRNTKKTSPSIFADDTKVNGKVDSNEESEFIQSD